MTDVIYHDLPSWVSIRFVVEDESEHIMFVGTAKDGKQFNVETRLKGFKISLLVPIMNNLGGMIFEHEHPGEFIRMIREEAQYVVKGLEVPEDIQVLKTRHKELISYSIAA